jgi:hypothetical protein
VGEFFASGVVSGAGHGGGGVGEEGVAGGVPADAGEGQGADDQRGFLVEVIGSADHARVVGGLVVDGGATERDAGVAEQLDGDGVAAGFISETSPA